MIKKKHRIHKPIIKFLNAGRNIKMLQLLIRWLGNPSLLLWVRMQINVYTVWLIQYDHGSARLLHCSTPSASKNYMKHLEQDYWSRTIVFTASWSAWSKIDPDYCHFRGSDYCLYCFIVLHAHFGPTPLVVTNRNMPYTVRVSKLTSILLNHTIAYMHCKYYP